MVSSAAAAALATPDPPPPHPVGDECVPSTAFRDRPAPGSPAFALARVVAMEPVLVPVPMPVAVE